MRQFIFILFSIISTKLYSQIDSSKNKEGNFVINERMPIFLNGGEKGLMKILSDSVRYPPAAIKDNIGGIVRVEFTIDTTGNLENIRILKSISEDIDNEALRVVAFLNGWQPGYQNEKKVKVVYAIPVGFWPNPKFKRKYLKNESKVK